MRKLFFCARDLQDYLSHVRNIDKLNLPAAKSYAPELLDLPIVQEILGSMTENFDGEIFWQTGIVTAYDWILITACGLMCRREISASESATLTADKFFSTASCPTCD